MGLLIAFGDDPELRAHASAASIPQFTPPPLPVPVAAAARARRSQRELRPGPRRGLLRGHHQHGAVRRARRGVLRLQRAQRRGHFGFDALLRFSPFYFIVEISAGFSVKVFGVGVWGVHLRGALEGPTPWHIPARPAISLLFFAIDVDVDVTLGERRDTSCRRSRCCRRSATSSRSPTAGGAAPPAPARLLVSLRELGDAEACWCCTRRHAADQPAVRAAQPARSTRSATRSPPTSNRFDGQRRRRRRSPSEAPVREKFAAAQFRRWTTRRSCPRPPFELFDGGVELGAAGSQLDDRRTRRPRGRSATRRSSSTRPSGGTERVLRVLDRPFRPLRRRRRRSRVLALTAHRRRRPAVRGQGRGRPARASRVAYQADNTRVRRRRDLRQLRRGAAHVAARSPPTRRSPTPSTSSRLAEVSVA